MPKLALHWQILIAIVLAIFFGSIIGKDTALFGIAFYDLFNFVGTLFLNGLKMIIVPLVFSSIICGVAGMGDGKGFGRLTGKTLLFYMCSSLVAILIGLMIVNLTQPGVIDGQPAQAALNQGVTTEEVAQELSKVGSSDASDVVEVFLRMVPVNVVQAAAEGQMLGLIFFAMLFGYFMVRLSSKEKHTLLDFWQAVFDTMMSITLFVMKFTPIGVFGLIAKTFIDFDAGNNLVKLAETYLVFFITVVSALILHVFVALTLALRFIARVNPFRHYKAMAPALLTAFSTASSSGTLPLTMECVEKNAGVSNRTTSFVLPLGATINMDGTALYECVAAMFIAQAYGLELTFATQFTVVIIALLTSIGVAGVPSASLVAITVILGAIGLPLDGIVWLLVTDRILDMLRTAVNVFSDSCCAVVIAKSEGEREILAHDPSPESS